MIGRGRMDGRTVCRVCGVLDMTLSWRLALDPLIKSTTMTMQLIRTSSTQQQQPQQQQSKLQPT